MTGGDKDSLVEMLAKIPITETKGSLLSAIGKLLRVIDISESSIMIPTLLKDKCEFDAYEMLTLAKILKASILGHNDLVEFYMSESSSQLNSPTTTPTTTTTGSLLSSQAVYKHQHQTIHHPLALQHLQSSSSASPSLGSSASESASASSRSTPQPRLDSSAMNNLLQMSARDPDATLRLLLQIEQLKTFIPQVTGLFESIIELYKTSVDTIT